MIFVITILAMMIIITPPTMYLPMSSKVSYGNIVSLLSFWLCRVGLLLFLTSVLVRVSVVSLGVVPLHGKPGGLFSLATVRSCLLKKVYL